MYPTCGLHLAIQAAGAATTPASDTGGRWVGMKVTPGIYARSAIVLRAWRENDAVTAARRALCNCRQLEQTIGVTHASCFSFMKSLSGLGPFGRGRATITRVSKAHYLDLTYR
eukprot:6211743-Pleurochrysis_carterae.AAC.2